MNVVFKKRILDRITDARHTSLREQRDIDHIELTVKEARQLIGELGYVSVFFSPGSPYLAFNDWLFTAENSGSHIPMTPSPALKVMGIDIKVLR